MDKISFEEFWKAYPLRKAKKEAVRAWNRLSASDQKAAIAALPRYIDYCQQKGIAYKYAQGWLNGCRWEDEYEEPQPKASQPKQAAVQDPTAAPPGFRWASDEEQASLERFRQALADKKPCKPEHWAEFQRDVVQQLCIPYVRLHDGVVFLCVRHSNRLERISEYMIDYYDSYAEFCQLLRQFFDITRITFNV